MVRRNRKSVFMGGAHVFPGGAVEDFDRGADAARVVAWTGTPEEHPWRAAAVRELAEEAGVVLCDDGPRFDGQQGADFYRLLLDAGAVVDAGRLEYLSNWVTPIGPPRRFDTRFFVTTVPPDTLITSDRREVFDAEWVDPEAALAAAEEGRWQIELPTKVHLELLAGFDSAAAVVEHARLAEPSRIEPQVAVTDDGEISVLLPGQSGFEAS
jgi:8-oxo-dGTP pyrophosphatase MutT (NUDIX family)